MVLGALLGFVILQLLIAVYSFRFILFSGSVIRRRSISLIESDYLIRSFMSLVQTSTHKSGNLNKKRAAINSCLNYKRLLSLSVVAYLKHTGSQTTLLLNKLWRV